MTTPPMTPAVPFSPRRSTSRGSSRGPGSSSSCAAGSTRGQPYRLEDRARLHLALHPDYDAVSGQFGGVSAGIPASTSGDIPWVLSERPTVTGLPGANTLDPLGMSGIKCVPVGQCVLALLRHSLSRRSLCSVDAPE